MEQNKSYIVSIAVALVSLALNLPSGGASRTLASVEAPPDMPDWLKLTTRGDDVIGRLFKSSIADSVFIAVKKDNYVPPIQYLTRSAKGDLEARSEQIAKEVLASPNIKVDLTAKSTIRLNPYNGKFLAGSKEDLPGYAMEYQSHNGTDTLITCIAVVKDDKRLHVIYTQARQTSLPKCSAELVSLAKSTYLVK